MPLQLSHTSIYVISSNTSPYIPHIQSFIHGYTPVQTRKKMKKTNSNSTPLYSLVTHLSPPETCQICGVSNSIFPDASYFQERARFQTSSSNRELLPDSCGRRMARARPAVVSSGCRARGPSRTPAASMSCSGRRRAQPPPAATAGHCRRTRGLVHSHASALGRVISIRQRA
jgi:hypothetical protein